MQPLYYLGIMSGTSLDGVDLALMDFSKQPKLIASQFTPMPADLRQALWQTIEKGEIRLQQLGELDHRLGLLYADCVQQFLRTEQLQTSQIQAIGCHGQTIWHAPTGQFPFSMQIGDMNLLAARTGICTIGDFRRKDMAFGGQGAPLVPAFHQAIFSAPHWTTVVLNIGGISNISLLMPEQATLGYDVGVGNALMDAWIMQHQGKSYDANGAWAAQGEVQPELLELMLAEPFFQQPPPKSTGRELFNLAWLQRLLDQCSPYAAVDVQATLLEFTAQGVQLALQQIDSPLPCRLLVCGGGAKNARLMQRLAQLLPSWQVAPTNDFQLDSDYVEAAAFAWLAYQRLHNLPANLPAVTGAQRLTSLGAIFPAENTTLCSTSAKQEA